jgi:dethiobiotin synthetase
LGTINHSLLTVRQARQMGLKVRGLVLNDTVGGRRNLAARTNMEIVPELCRTPLLGVMPHGTSGREAAARRICVRLFGEA